MFPSFGTPAVLSAGEGLAMAPGVQLWVCRAGSTRGYVFGVFLSVAGKLMGSGWWSCQAYDHS